MIRLSTLLLALGLGAHAAMLHADGSQDTMKPTARPVYGALSADQLSQIQGVSRAVLAAKGSQHSSVEEQALLDELHQLSASVDQALRFTPTSLSLSTTVGSASTSVQPENAGPMRQDKLKERLTPTLARLRQRRQEIDALPPGNGANQAQIVHVQWLSTQAGLLEQSVRDALSVAGDAERFARLAKVRQQLRSRSPGEWWEDREAQALAAGTPSPLPVTPTLITRTRHRLGLDDQHPGKH